MTKPFSLEELVARIRTILRRSGQAAPRRARRSCSPTSSSTRTSHEVTRGGRADRADRDRIPAAALPDAEPAPRADARAAARPRLELRLRRRRRACSRPTSATCARSSTSHGPPLIQHGARRRLRAAGAARLMRSLRARLLAGAARAGRARGCWRSRRSPTPSSARSWSGASTSRSTRRRRSAAAQDGSTETGCARRPGGARRAGRRGGRPGLRPGGRPGRRTRGGGAPAPNLPPGTYGELRDALRQGPRGTLHQPSTNARRPQPKLPAQRPARTARSRSARRAPRACSTACSRRQRPGDTGVQIVARPAAAKSQQTLSRLLLVEGLVIAGVLLALAARRLVRRCASGCVRSTASEATAGEIAAGDLSRRVSPADARTEVGRLGLALNAMLERLEQAFAERTGQRGAPAPLPRRRLARAAHAAGLDPRLRRAVPHGRRRATRPTPRTAMRRIEEEAERMGVLVEDLLDARAPGRGAARARARAASTSRRSPRDAVADARATAPRARDRRSTRPTPRGRRGDRDQLRQVLANLLRNALVHTPAGTPIEVSVERARRRRATLRVRDHGPGLPAAAASSCSSASGAPRAAASAAGRAPASGSRSRRAIVEAHGGAISAAQAERRRRGSSSVSRWRRRAAAAGGTAPASRDRPERACGRSCSGSARAEVRVDGELVERDRPRAAGAARRLARGRRRGTPSGWPRRCARCASSRRRRPDERAAGRARDPVREPVHAVRRRAPRQPPELRRGRARRAGASRSMSASASSRAPPRGLRRATCRWSWSTTGP